ncbi:hypothetical protein [Streptomyces phaeochromogenes]
MTAPPAAHLISRERRKELACQLFLEAGMVALSGGDMQPIVYIRNEEFADAVSVRAKTTELRNLLDQVDEMADRVFADHEGRS